MLASVLEFCEEKDLDALLKMNPVLPERGSRNIMV